MYYMYYIYYRGKVNVLYGTILEKWVQNVLYWTIGTIFFSVKFGIQFNLRKHNEILNGF